MKICLVTAATAAEFENPDEIDSESVQDAAQQPQLGILSLAAVLAERSFDLGIVNLNHAFLEHKRRNRPSHVEFSEFAADLIAQQDADLYGFGSISSSYPLTI